MKEDQKFSLGHALIEMTISYPIGVVNEIGYNKCCSGNGLGWCKTLGAINIDEVFKIVCWMKSPGN